MLRDPRFLRLLAWVNGLVPCLFLAWDAWRGQLGANAVNQAIHITGMVSLVLLLLTLAVTPLRRLTTWGELVAMRRPLGLWAFLYAALHFSLYFGLDRELNLASTLQEVLTRRFLLVGAAGVLLMLPLAVTSTDAMTRWLGGKRWKQLHRLAYVAAAAGVLHYFMLVKSDVRQPLLFAGSLGLLLGSRVAWAKSPRRPGLPPRSAVQPTTQPRAFWKGDLTVLTTQQETPDVRTFRLGLGDGAALPFEHRPGQYLTLKVDTGQRRVGRCYTIASSPTNREWCEITVKRDPQGVVSNWLHDHLQAGDRLAVGGSAGRFVFTGEEAGHVVLIAAGVGITPVMSIARWLVARDWPGRIDFLVAARSERDIIFHDELVAMERAMPGLTLRITLSQPATEQWEGSRGRISLEMLREWVPDIASSPAEVFLCGPNAMMQAVREHLAELGVPSSRVHTEAFAAPSGDRGPAADGSASLLNVTFSQAAREAPVHPEQTVLEAGEELGLDLPFECRSGICGQCRVTLLAGRVEMACDGPLSPEEREQGVILACQAKPITDVIIDA